MTDYQGSLRRAMADIDIDYDDDAVQRVRAGVQRRVRRRHQGRLVLFVSLPLLLLVAALGWRTLGPPRGLVASSATSPPAFRTHDGSAVQPLTSHSLTRVLKDEAAEVVIELNRGSARFDVVPLKAREFSVRAGSFEVRVLGTVFEIERIERGMIVKVERGTVRVLGPELDSLLSRGQQRTFLENAEPASTHNGPATPLASNAVPTSSHNGVAIGSSAPPAGSDWKTLARQRKFAQAYSLLRSPGAPAANSPEDLLLRADVARLSGHPAEALEPLRQLVERHASDSRAPSAWFTLGSIEEQLGRPRNAAQGFAKARALQPNGPLAEDALGREALALLTSGARPEGEARSREYLRRYPRGVRAQELRVRAGLP